MRGLSSGVATFARPTRERIDPAGKRWPPIVTGGAFALAASLSNGCGADKATTVADSGATLGVVDAGSYVDATGSNATRAAGSSATGSDASLDAASSAIGNDAGGSVTADQVATDLTASFCGRYAACLPLALQTIYGGLAPCEMRLKPVFASWVGAPGVVASLAAMDSCAAVQNTMTCADFLSNVTPAACNLSGSLAAGTACGASWQCASSYCQLAVQAACGVCGSPAPLDGGCALDTDCANGLICNGAQCITPGQPGEPCLDQGECLRTLGCSGGVCVTPTGAGSTCDDSNGYGITAGCDWASGLYCTGTCVLTEVADAGEPCSYPSPGVPLIGCNQGQICSVASGARTGTCPAPAAEGQSCTIIPNTSNCLPPAVCANGTCQTPIASQCH